MTQHRINRISAFAPVIMSLLALAIVLIVVTTGWQRHLKDEGAAAHLFQFLMVIQVPFILTFLTTANWGRIGQVLKPLSLQIFAAGLALTSVAFFKL